MTSANGLISQLAEQLAQEDLLLRQFRDVLTKEHEVLSRKNVDDLTAVITEKNTLVEQIQAAVAARIDSTRGLSGSDTESMDSVLERFGKDHPEILATWNALQGLLDECQSQNSINGRIIEHSSVAIKTALSILNNHVENTELYNAKGRRKDAGGSGNPLAKA